LKHALAFKKEKPDIAVYILYRDMMTSGFVETYYTQARRAGVVFIQYTPEHPPRVEAEQEQLTVRVHDPILDLPLEIKTDLLELAVGITPTPAGQLAAAMGIAADEDGFFEEADTKWRPVESIREGIFACGLSLAPGTIAEAVLSGQAAAQRAMRILKRSGLPAGTTSAWVRTSLCALCRRCIDTCPYAARWIDEEVQQVVVNPAMCQGCGACAAVCPNGAAVLAGYGKHQVLDMIDAVFTA
jgi:heterodisulfide reductase subunit A